MLTHRVFDVEQFALREARARAQQDLRAVAVHELATLGIASLTKKLLALDQMDRERRLGREPTSCQSERSRLGRAERRSDRDPQGASFSA